MVGILAGTLGAAQHVSMARRLQQLITDSGRKAYSFVVGKINVAKLANFPEVDVFVLVACAEQSLVDWKARLRLACRGLARPCAHRAPAAAGARS